MAPDALIFRDQRRPGRVAPIAASGQIPMTANTAAPSVASSKHFHGHARWFCLRIPRSSVGTGTTALGGGRKGSGGTWNRGRDFPGPGAVPGSPSYNR